MQQHRFTRYTALAGAVAAMLVTGMVACGNNDDGAAPAQARKPLSGEELFRGLVFGEGPVAAQFPEVWSHLKPRQRTPEQEATVERAKAQLLADIRQADPTFFDRFGADIQSGDHLRIEQAMDESAKLVKQVAQKRAPSPDERHESGVAIAAAGVIITVAVAANAVEVVNFGEAFNVYITSNFAYNENYFWDDSGGEKLWAGSQLGRDQMVEMMAQRLATN